LQFNVLAAIGEFEKGLIRERSREGREKAKARGVKFGAKPKLSSDEVQMLVKDYESPGLSKPEIAELYGIRTSSAYRLYYENNPQITMSAEQNGHPFRWPSLQIKKPLKYLYQ
jgi:DNA invertase Pin-like site-specific DNA recombinase